MSVANHYSIEYLGECLIIFQILDFRGPFTVVRRFHQFNIMQKLLKNSAVNSEKDNKILCNPLTLMYLRI